MRRLRDIALPPLALALVAAGCFGGGGGGAASSHPAVTSSAARPVLDPRTKRRLLAEYRASLITCPRNAFCAFKPGLFWTGGDLLMRLRRAHPSIPATRNLGATLSMNGRFVFVLPDSTATRLDIATAAADGRYVHLIAVGRRHPSFRFGAL